MKETMTETYFPDIEIEETEQAEQAEQVRAEKPQREHGRSEHLRADYDSLMRVAKAAGVNQMWARVSADYLKYASGNPVEEAKIIASLRIHRPEMFKPDLPAKREPRVGRR